MNIISFRYNKTVNSYLVTFREKNVIVYEAMYSPKNFSEAVAYVMRSAKNYKVKMCPHVAGRIFRSLDWENIQRYDDFPPDHV